MDTNHGQPEPASTSQGLAIDPIMRLPAVEAATGLKKSSLYALMAERKFPLSVRISSRAVGWKASAVRAWLNAREENAARVAA